MGRDPQFGAQGPGLGLRAMASRQPCGTKPYSHVAGSATKGLRETRPRAGDCAVTPLGPGNPSVTPGVISLNPSLSNGGGIEGPGPRPGAETGPLGEEFLESIVRPIEAGPEIGLG